MVNLDPATAATMRRLARKIDHLDRRVRDQARASQGTRRSVEAGAQEVYDDDGELRAIVGIQEDGAYTITSVGGPAADVPSPPLVAQLPGGVTITWDGFDANDEAGWPTTFRRVRVHLSTV